MHSAMIMRPLHDSYEVCGLEKFGCGFATFFVLLINGGAFVVFFGSAQISIVGDVAAYTADRIRMQRFLNRRYSKTRDAVAQSLGTQVAATPRSGDLARY